MTPRLLVLMLGLLFVACGDSNSAGPSSQADATTGDTSSVADASADASSVLPDGTPPVEEDTEPSPDDTGPANADVASDVTEPVGSDAGADVIPTPEPGWFSTGQDAAVLLGAVDFNRSGGGGLFNHPKGIATDGTRLLLADGNNNRVLVWTTLPTGTVDADLVLGQPDLESNDSGEGATEMKWPVDVTTAGGVVVVADTYNHRLLIWHTFPTEHGQAPDMIMEGLQAGEPAPMDPTTERFAWPWGVWTDGTRLVVTSTASGNTDNGIKFGGWVLIWETFPTTPDQPADIVLDADGDLGTPRGITTDGQSFLIIGDHNAQGTDIGTGSWLWSSFPTASYQSADGFLTDPANPFIWLQGDVSPDGEVLMVADALHVWGESPQESADGPTVSVDKQLCGSPSYTCKFRGGDGSSVAIAGETVFVSDYNANRVLVYEERPSAPSDKPSFALGAPDFETDTFAENHFVTNGCVASNGESLCVGDGYDKRLNCWATIPTESAQPPTGVFDFEDGVRSLAMHDNELVGVGPMGGIRHWKSLPLQGESPDAIYGNKVGSVTFSTAEAVALDASYFYLLDGQKRLYGWPSVPEGDEVPVFTLDLDGPTPRIYADGEFLTISTDKSVTLYAVSSLASGPVAQPLPPFAHSNNLGQAIVDDGHLFVADFHYNCVYVWEDVQQALSAQGPDALLGASDPEDVDPDTRRDGLFWPKTLAWDGQRLWVGEYKFSGRVVGFARP